MFVMDNKSTETQVHKGSEKREFRLPLGGESAQT